jgi:hypothetical protein
MIDQILRSRKATGVLNVVRQVCDRCGSRVVVDVPIHEGESRRRDCRRCGRFLGWPKWQGRDSIGEC